jgi:3-oxoacid CoA-transferase subunit B
LCVLDVTPTGFKCLEFAPGVTADEIRTKTGCPVDMSAVG